MAGDLDGKVAIVTGSAGGIGRSIAERMVRGGAAVVVSDVQEEMGRRTAAELGGETLFIPCDVTDPAAVEGLVDGAIARFGRLDVMVNNAGINSNRPEDRVTFERYPIETFRRIVEVDLLGAFHGCRTAAARMLERGSGSIVNIASVAGVVALRLQIGYVAAKAAVIRMTEAMACELGPRGIRVNCVSPGSILTDGTRDLFYKDAEKARRVLSFIPQGRPGETRDIAGAVAYLASDAASYVNGHNLVVDGGWTCGFNRDF
jgi:NAD(P)-dependent dehydrogenase (short-subunit alcohol dehydrogenase family)